MKIGDNIIYALRWFNALFFALLAALLFSLGFAVFSAGAVLGGDIIPSEYKAFIYLGAIVLFVLGTLLFLLTRPMLGDPILPLLPCGIGGGFASASLLYLSSLVNDVGELITFLLGETLQLDISRLDKLRGMLTGEGIVLAVLAVLCVGIVITLTIMGAVKNKSEIKHNN